MDCKCNVQMWMSYGHNNERLIRIVKCHFYNHVMAEKGNLLLLSEMAPAYWGTKLADLSSRLSSIPAIKIQPPDEKLLTQVIQKLFNDLQLKVDEAVIHFLTKHMERSFESAHMWTSALNTFALTQRRDITIPLVREALVQPELVGIHL